MEVGTAIFLSTLAAIIFFTRDRVRWGRIFAIGFATVVTLSAAVGGVLYVVNSYEFRRTAVSELDGIKLGDSEHDVLFKRGDYTEKCFYDGTKNLLRYVFEDKTTNKVVGVGLRDGLVQRIFVWGELGYNNPMNAVAVHDGDSEDTIREKWGKEDFIRSIDTSLRHYVYRRYNLLIALKNNSALGIVVFNPQYYYKDASVPPDRKEECFDKDGAPKK